MIISLRLIWEKELWIPKKQWLLMLIVSEIANIGLNFYQLCSKWKLIKQRTKKSPNSNSHSKLHGDTIIYWQMTALNLHHKCFTSLIAAEKCKITSQIVNHTQSQEMRWLSFLNTITTISLIYGNKYANRFRIIWVMRTIIEYLDSSYRVFTHLLKMTRRRLIMTWLDFWGTWRLWLELLMESV